MLYLLLYSCMEFFNFYALYRYVLGVKFTKSKKIYAATMLSVFLINELKRRMMFLFPIVYLISALINVFGAFLLALIVRESLTNVINSKGYTLIAEFTTDVFSLIYGYCKKLRKEMKMKIIQYNALLIGLVCFIFVIAFLQMADGGYNIKNRAIIAKDAAFVLIAFLFAVLSIWQTVTWKRAQKYQLENAVYETYIHRQEEYIRLIIENEEKMRRFRHDIKAHFTAMDGLLKYGETEQLQQYLYTVQEKLKDNKLRVFTGITAVDAIVSEYYNRAQDNQILWSWEGRLALPDTVSIFSICTIFSNLLSNAVEACEKIEGERQIKIKIKSIEDVVCIKIINTADKSMSINDLEITSKKDSLNHGLGLKTVKEMVEAVQGKIEYRLENGWFEIEILL